MPDNAATIPDALTQPNCECRNTPTADEHRDNETRRKKRYIFSVRTCKGV